MTYERLLDYKYILIILYVIVIRAKQCPYKIQYVNHVIFWTRYCTFSNARSKILVSQINHCYLNEDKIAIAKLALYKFSYVFLAALILDSSEVVCTVQDSQSGITSLGFQLPHVLLIPRSYLHRDSFTRGASDACGRDFHGAL